MKIGCVALFVRRILLELISVNAAMVFVHVICGVSNGNEAVDGSNILCILCNQNNGSFKKYVTRGG